MPFLQDVPNLNLEKSVCGRKYFCDLEVLCEVLQPFGNTFPVAVSRNSFDFAYLLAPMKQIDPAKGDVEEKVVAELDDSPGTTHGTKISVLQKGLIPIFGQTWLTTTGPLASATVLFAKLAKGHYGGSILEQLHSEKI